MTEPLQVFASALTTVELALKLYRSLSTFAGKVQHAPKAAKGLIAKAQRLRGTLYMVHLTLQVWICQLRDRKPTVAEQCIWRNIETSLAYWKRTLRRFKREMNGLSIVAEGQRMSWVEKTWWQLKHERKDPILQSLQGSMMDCIAQLSLSLQCLNLLMHTPTQREREKELLDIDRKVKQAQEVNHNTVSASDLSNSSDRMQRSEQDTKRMNNCIIAAKAAKNVVKKASDTNGEGEPLSPIDSILEEVEWENIGNESDDEEEEDVEDYSGKNVIPQNTASETLEEDPDPDFDDTMPREPLRRMIKYYLEEVPAPLRDSEHLEHAEHLQRRLIKYAKDWNQIYEPPIDMTRLHLKLSEILGMQQNDPAKIDEGVRNLLNNFPGPHELSGGPIRHTESSLDPHRRLEQAYFYQGLAQLRLKQYHVTQHDERFLDLAEKWAKRCFKLRFELRDDPESEFIKSVHELIKVVKLQKHSSEAVVYHDLYIKSSEAAIPPLCERTPRSSSRGPAAPASSFSPASFSSWRDIDDHDSLGFTPLISAIDHMDTSKVDKLIDHGVDVEKRDLDDKTPLLHAALQKDESMIVKLRKAGASMDAICKGQTVLHHMICLGNPQMVRSLLENGAGIEVPGPGEFTPIFHAVLRDKVETLNDGSTKSETTAHALDGSCCPQLENQAEIVQTLCYHYRGPSDSLQQPDINAYDKQGWTALMYAMQSGRSKIFEILLSNGANANTGCSVVGKTPLHYAIDWKQGRFAEMLLERGANPNAEDRHKRTPLISAVRETNTYQLIELLLKWGAIIDWNKFDKTLNKDVRDLLKSGAERRDSMSSMGTASSSQSRYSFSTTRSRTRLPQV